MIVVLAPCLLFEICTVSEKTHIGGMTTRKEKVKWQTKLSNSNLCWTFFIHYSLSLALRQFLSIALRIPTAHDFPVISARTWALARTKRKRFPSNWARWRNKFSFSLKRARWPRIFYQVFAKNSLKKNIFQWRGNKDW